MQPSQSAQEYLNFAGAVEGLGVGIGTGEVQGYHFAAAGVLLGGLLLAQISGKICPWEMQSLILSSAFLD